MIIIGELLNSTREKIRKALAEKDAAFLQDLAIKQQDAGVSYIDVNAGAFAERELDVLEWLIKVVREVTDLPLSIDSPKPEALALGCRLAGDDVILNSITAEQNNFRSIVPIIREFNTKVIALPMDHTGLSEDEGKIFSIANSLIESLGKEGVSPDRIFIDPLIRPIATNTVYGPLALNLIRRFASSFPETRRICGLSNVSFGLPKRKTVNQTFLIMAMASGLDAAIMDPLDEALMSQVKAAQALLDLDPYCMNYINAMR
ncbi:dihydropteroate synthase [Candidatus Sumerlaeota bacterium]|nr:dihydropteroate synthase [Candidatus Sumerlaeota bacterium]